MEYAKARLTPRYPLAVDAEISDAESNVQVKGRTKILSLHGCGLESVNLFRRGMTVRIKLSHQGADVWALARIVYASPDLGTGVAFTNIGYEDERILEIWLEEFLSIPIQGPYIVVGLRCITPLSSLKYIHFQPICLPIGGTMTPNQLVPVAQ